MDLNNILKTVLKHLKKYYICFISFWLIISIILLLQLSKDAQFFGFIYLFYIVSSLFFSLVLGSLIYGSYGKTFISIQNNRKNYVIFSFLFCLINAICFTILICLLRIKALDYNYKPISLNIILISFLTYVLFFSLGSLYGLFVKYNKLVKRVVYLLAFLGTVILSYFALGDGFNLIISIVNMDCRFNEIYFFIAVGIIDIVIMILCSIYYLKLNILKSYSNE